MTKKDAKEKLLQWHPAFFASLQIELAKEADKLIFENEHTLSTKPMQIDVLIIKKNTNENIQKNIGRIFKKHNIIEYKSPTDYLSVDDFYKVYGYTCFYKSSTSKQNSICANDITITFVCTNYPKYFVDHLINTRNMTITKVFAGIYYISGDFFPIQLIITSKLSNSDNLWLRSLTNNLNERTLIDKLSEDYINHENEELYKSAMNVIIRANKKQFKEANNMCEALRELVDEIYKDKLEEELAIAREEALKEGRAEGIAQGLAEGRTQGIAQGIHSTIKSCKLLGATKAQTLNMIIDCFTIPSAEAELYMNRYW